MRVSPHGDASGSNRAAAWPVAQLDGVHDALGVRSQAGAAARACSVNGGELSLAKSMRDSGDAAQLRCIRVPGEGRPESVTLLIQRRRDHASASRITHIPVAIRTYATAATPQRHPGAEAEISDIAQSAGIRSSAEAS